ncbi:MAG: response regulator [Deltaproteobacteria bacterium]|nr:response regulator [Deltaproteobacteria bacterium]
METVNIRKRVNAQLIHQLYSRAAIGIIATIVNSFILCLILWHRISRPVLLTWLVATLLMAASRSYMLYRYRKTTSEQDAAKRWGVLFVINILLSGILWGSTGIFLFPLDSIAHQVFIAFVLAGMVSGAVGTFSSVITVFSAFSFPALFPILIRFFIIGDDIHIAMGVMTIIFIALTFFTALRINLSSRELVMLKEHFATMVEERTEDLKKANDGLNHEIAERRKNEEDLRKSEERYRELADSIKDVFFAMDREFKCTFWNRASEKMTGILAKAAIGRSFYEIFPMLEGSKVEELFLDTLSAQQPKAILDEYCFGNADLCFEINAYPSKGGLSVFGKDITDRKKVQEQLQQAQKMEAISTLAGGIAHEFNNNLSVIVANLDLLEMDFPDKNHLDRHLKQMKSASNRMSHLTSHLLAYARGGKYQVRAISLNELINDTLILIMHTIDPSIGMNINLPSDIFSVKADPAQMQMLLTAVVKNASEAIEGKGRIDISTRLEEIDDLFIKKHPGLKPGYYVCLTIEDDGKGMDEETKNRIFEPFFTTKFQGRGLGMAATYGIVKNHDGWISVYSEVGEGTVIKLYFPAIEAPREKLKKTKVEPAKGDETVLVIEDDERVLNICGALLKNLGYRVLKARTGKKALNVAKTHESNIDVAILDVVLPDIGGKEIYPLLMQERPNLKVIVYSGYSINGPAQEILNAGAHDFIQKPFSLAELSEKLRRVLEIE